MPACLLTPIASYMTMRLKPRQTGKRESATPWQMATEVERAVQRAEWEEGIPPDANKSLKSHFLSMKKFRKTFMDCAISHASSPDTKVGLAASVATKELIRSFAFAVTLSRATPKPPWFRRGCKALTFTLVGGVKCVRERGMQLLNGRSVGVREKRESMSWALCDWVVQSAFQSYRNMAWVLLLRTWHQQHRKKLQIAFLIKFM